MSRYSKYRRRVFEEWKQRVNKRLPDAVIKFYSCVLNGKYIRYEKHKLLGQVIADINNPYYAITNRHGDLLDEIGIISSEVILSIQVEELFKFINTEL